MSFREAAVLPVAYLTAYMLLFEIGNIKPGQTLLFHCAGGGVGGEFICPLLASPIADGLL